MSKNLLLIICLSLIPLTAARAQNALGDAMTDMFDGAMVTTTTPGFYEGVTSGVITGGGFQLRQKIIQTPLVGLTPPSFSSGCGGIDLYTGSFSFISKDEFLALIRNVASHAKGYLFQLAISRMCNPCEAKMAQLSKIVREINQNFSNSCHMAQGLVNDMIPALENKEKWKSSSYSFATGADDVFDAFTGAGSGTPAASERDALIGMTGTDLPTCENEGNVVWCILNQKNVTDNLTVMANVNGVNAQELQELLMSITGTFILAPAEDVTVDGDQTVEKPKSHLPGRQLTITDLIKGGDAIKVYQCNDSGDADKCLDVSTHDIALEGFENILTTELLSYIDAITGGGGGILSATTPTPESLLMLETIGGSVGVMLTRLAQVDRTGGLAQEFLAEFSEYMALKMAWHMIDNYIKAVGDPLKTSKHTYAAEVIENMGKVFKEYYIEYETHLSENPEGLVELSQLYKELMKNKPSVTSPDVGSRSQ